MIEGTVESLSAESPGQTVRGVVAIVDNPGSVVLAFYVKGAAGALVWQIGLGQPGRLLKGALVPMPMSGSIVLLAPEWHARAEGSPCGWLGGGARCRLFSLYDRRQEVARAFFDRGSAGLFEWMAGEYERLAARRA